MKAFQSIQISYGISQQLPVYEIPMLSSPMLFSIRNPRILLPAENNYSDDDLHFIFRHEMTHFLQVIKCEDYVWKKALDLKASESHRQEAVG